MPVSVTPLHDRILVKRIEEKETVKGGIIVPDTAKEKPQEGEVIAVGAGKLHEGKRIPLDVEVGDRILFGKYSGTEIKIEDEEYLIFREDDVLGKMAKAAKALPRNGNFLSVYDERPLQRSHKIPRKKQRRLVHHGSKANCDRRGFASIDSPRREHPG